MTSGVESSRSWGVSVPGGEGELVEVKGETGVAVLSIPFAPGAPIELTIDVEDGVVRARGKAARSQRREDGRYDVRMRFVDLRKADRARLLGG